MNDLFFDRPPDGWLDLPGIVEAVASSQPFQSFSDTEAGADSTPLPDHAFLWESARKVTGGLLPPGNQGKIGSCVAFGTARAIQYSMLGEIIAGEREEFHPLVEEVIYGLARHEIGMDNLRGDGAVGANAAEGVRRYGIINRGIHGKYDLREYSEITCRSFGRFGVPDDLEPFVKQHPVRFITRIKNWQEAKKALASHYGIAICSNRGFKMTRDAQGFSQPWGTWSHCMTLCGYQTGPREGGRIDNSWGGFAHTGPVGAGNPGPEGFWADAEVIERDILRTGDCWAFSGIEGFASRRAKIDWNTIS